MSWTHRNMSALGRCMIAIERQGLNIGRKFLHSNNRVPRVGDCCWRQLRSMERGFTWNMHTPDAPADSLGYIGRDGLNHSGKHSICSFMLGNARLPLDLPLHPSLNRISISDPLRDQTLVGFVLDLPRFNTIPLLHDGPVGRTGALILPALHPQAPEMQLDGGRNLRHRRRSMKKHWRKKHFKRDLVIYRKRERRRKMAAEKVFRDRLNEAIKEAEEFDAKAFVDDFLTKVELNKGHQAPPSILITESKASADQNLDAIDSSVTEKSGKRFKGPFVHWTDLISIEQLYGLPPSKYIDLNAGKANEEEWQEILRLRELYEKTFKKREKIDESKEIKDSD